MTHISRPSPLNNVSYSEACKLLSDRAYVGLSADQSRKFDQIIVKTTDSPYSHAMLIGHATSSGDLLLTESTWPCSDVFRLSDRLREADLYFQPQSGLIDVFRVKGQVNLPSAWDWSLLCAGIPYSIADNLYIWLDRFKGHQPRRVPENSDDPKGCKRDCSCQVHAALRVAGLRPVWPSDLPYDCMVAPCDLCEAANPDWFEYVCTPTWP